MPDVIMLSSVFDVQKMAEPMGVSILASCLRMRNIEVHIVEPSLHGMSPVDAAQEIARQKPTVVGLSMLRDKNVDDVLTFVRACRAAAPAAFIVVGGHGPTIALAEIRDSVSRSHPLQLFRRDDAAKSTLARASHPPVAGARAAQDPVTPPRSPEEALCSTELAKTHLIGARVPNELTGRGLGAAGAPGTGCEGPTKPSPYYDRSAEYLQILAFIDAFMLGEADITFPELVERVLAGGDWRSVPGVVFRNDAGALVFNPLPPKIDDLDTVPFMARDILSEYQKRYAANVPASILTSRGCHYRCTFCSVVKYEALQSGDHHRWRSNENIIAEMRHLRDTFGVTHFNFEDDNVLVKNKRGIERLHALCDMIIRELPGITFSIFCRADAVSESLFSHLKQAGLSNVYVGIESMYDGDLEFFHKGLTLETNERALTTLRALGYSADVDASLRIMLGFITWHPRSSFGSLKAASEFVKEYSAPPKLLRRKLRLYAGTAVLEEVDRMGLLDPDHPDGWRFRDSRLEGLDRMVDRYAARANNTRDRLRTIEKAHDRCAAPVLEIERVRELRQSIDRQIVRMFDEMVAAAAEAPDGASSPSVRALSDERFCELEQELSAPGVRRLVADGYHSCGLALNATDVFRK